MKKGWIIVIVVAVLLVVALGLYLLFYPGNGQEHSFKAVVVETGDNSLLVYKTQEDNNRLCYLNLTESALEGQDGAQITAADIQPGQLVYVRHGDVVQESFPPIYPQVYEVKVTGVAPDELFEQAKEAANWLAPPEVPDASVASEVPDSSTPVASQPPVVDIPADTALYRGVVQSVDIEENTTRLTLARAPGTDFGYPELEVLLNEATTSNFDRDTLTDGSYVEVWYGVPMSGQVAQPVTAVVANLLPDADICLFNGEVLEVNETDAGSGAILLEALDGSGQMVFFYDEDTAIYLDIEALSAGDKRNIYFSGASTFSLPPQATALEMRPYYAG